MELQPDWPAAVRRPVSGQHTRTGWDISASDCSGDSAYQVYCTEVGGSRPLAAHVYIVLAKSVKDSSSVNTSYAITDYWYNVHRLKSVVCLCITSAQVHIMFRTCATYHLGLNRF